MNNIIFWLQKSTIKKGVHLCYHSTAHIHISGLPAKPLIYVKRQEVPLEERFKYVSDDDSLPTDDEEWSMGAKPKKEDKPEQPVNWGMKY